VRYPCGSCHALSCGMTNLLAAWRIPWIADHRDLWVDADDTVRPAQRNPLALT